MNHISSERKLLGLTQIELAQRVDVDPSTINRWENGAYLSQPYIERLREIFGCSVDWLLGLTDTRIPIKAGH